MPIIVVVIPEKFENCVLAASTKFVTKSVGIVIMFETRESVVQGTARFSYAFDTNRIIKPFICLAIAKAKKVPTTAPSKGRKACTELDSTV